MMLFVWETPPAPLSFLPQTLDHDDYQVIVLRKGPASTPVSTLETGRLHQGHLANVRALWDSGALVAAGPVSGSGDVRGIFILKAGSLLAARALASRDPSVKAGRLAMDFYAWWGTRGIGEAYRDALAATPNLPDRMRSHVFALAKKGPCWTGADTPEARAAQRAHLERVAALKDTGHIAAAGPLSGDGEYRGAWIFRAGSPEAAAHLLADDPLVRGNQLEVEFHAWSCAEGMLPAPPP